MKSISIHKVNAALLLIILTAVILYYGKVFLVPLFFAILLAMLFRPVCNKLEKWGIGRVWSTLIGILLILLFIAGVFFIVGAQAANISEDMPRIQEKAIELLEATQNRIEGQFGVSPKKQIEYLQKGISRFAESANSFITSFLSGAFGLITGFVLVLLYFFFLMWKREKYQEFFLRLVKRESQEEVKQELNQITHVAGQYMIGRFVSMAFLAVFYIIGFSVVGLESAVLISLVAVLPTIVPYVGAFIGGFFPLVMALISQEPGMILPVTGILIVAQVIDNNIIEPLVEGESLDISPIFTIIAIVLGELVWGVAGMILFIPMFAILKIICDHLPALNPFGFLLTNELEEPKWMEKIKGKLKGKG